jgi:O-antigen ligase
MNGMLYSYRSAITGSLLLAMIPALFFSRGLLSLLILLFSLTTVFFYYRERGLLSLSLPLTMALLFLIPFVSGWWSNDIADWWGRCQVKLPLLVLPAALLCLRPSRSLVAAFNQLFIFCVTGASLYSATLYMMDAGAMETNYQRAKVMPTLPDNDHIRFSWMVVIALLLLIYEQKKIRLAMLRITGWVVFAWLIIYLHLLAAKTGILLFYFCTIVYLLHQWGQKAKVRLLAVLALLALLPVLAYQLLPTFKNRANYILYDLSKYKKNEYQEGMSDGPRLLSMQAGLYVFKENAIIGAGYGDVKKESLDWYAQYRPQLKPYEQILPSSQYILYAAGCGLAGLIVFLVALALPLMRRFLYRDVFFLCFYLSALLGFVYEIHLEGQFGVFIFCFFACWLALLAKREEERHLPG